MAMPDAKDVAFIHDNKDGTFTYGLITKEMKMIPHPVTGKPVKSEMAVVRRVLIPSKEGEVLAKAVAEFRRTDDGMIRDFLKEKQTEGERKHFNAKNERR